MNSKKTHYRCSALVFFLLASGVHASAKAANGTGDNQVSSGSKLFHVTGLVGIADYRQWHALNQPYPSTSNKNNKFNTHSTAYGGDLYLESISKFNFSVGMGASFVSPVTHSNNPDSVLTDNSGQYNITKGYINYAIPDFRVRLGRQLIRTPLASVDQLGFIPRSFQGMTVGLEPIKLFGRYFNDSSVAKETNKDTDKKEGSYKYTYNKSLKFTTRKYWNVFFGRITRYESRFGDKFINDNRYVNDVDGFTTVGTSFQLPVVSGEITGRAFYYDFLNTEKSEYIEFGYRGTKLADAKSAHEIVPEIRFQYLHGTGGGDSKLGNLESDIYALKFGVDSNIVDMAIFGHYSPEHNGSWRGGQFVHPYSAKGIIYTDTENLGVFDIGPGYGYGISAIWKIKNDLKVFAKYARYVAKTGISHNDNGPSGSYVPQSVNDGFPLGSKRVKNQHSWALDVGFKLDMSSISENLSNFTVSDVIDIDHFNGAHNGIDNRFRVLYRF